MGKNKKELIIENPLGLKHFDESLLIEINREIARRKQLMKSKLRYEDGKLRILKP